ncbi:hypothetical protein WICPIJ_001368 [Wickerhamomyces pijperi]|uniref:Uncharacterized protein n=1 Tax=Wickerhamomyces pijperi TaxID=599730 RepID=A0A9P8TR75_WICPI|nr:hypothetical protein WICPIJ_001368 [Wickerhamomyces pijperi]
MKSAGMTLVPWWTNWKKECWALVAGSPKRMEPVEGTNGRPDRVSTTDPVFETEHVGGVDTELGNFFSVSGQSDEVLSNVGGVLDGFQEPGLGRVGIGDGFSSGEIRTTDTDVDDISDGLTGVTLPFTRTNLVGEFLDVLQDGIDFWSNVLAVNVHWLVGSVSQSDVVHSTVFGGVDVVTFEKSISQFSDVGLLG